MKKLFPLLLALLSSPAFAQVYAEFQPANGILVGQTTTYKTTAAAQSDIYSLLVTTSCATGQPLLFGGGCAGFTTSLVGALTITTAATANFTIPSGTHTGAVTDASQTFAGNQTFTNLAHMDGGIDSIPNGAVGSPSIAFAVGSNYGFYSGGSAIRTAINGVLITNTASTGFSVTGAIAGSAAVTLPGLASSSAATTGTVCWTTSTGNLTVDTTLACLSSTKRIKRNIRPLDVGLDEVMALHPISYDLKPEYNGKGLGPQIGLVAEDVAKVDSRLIGKDEEGQPLGVRYMQLTALLVQSIQEQQKEIESLKRQVKKLH